MPRAFILTLLICAGCGSGVNQVEFVVPNGFQGSIVLMHIEGARELPFVGGRYIVEVPESGEVAFGGYFPFSSYLCTGRFANGDPLWVSTRGDEPEDGVVCLLSGGSSRSFQGTVGENNGSLVPTGPTQYRWFVGTKEQWKTHKW
jgi:hypothetical protein